MARRVLAVGTMFAGAVGGALLALHATLAWALAPAALTLAASPPARPPPAGNPPAGRTTKSLPTPQVTPRQVKAACPADDQHDHFGGGALALRPGLTLTAGECAARDDGSLCLTRR
jgi:hypothetical protein